MKNKFFTRQLCACGQKFAGYGKTWVFLWDRKSLETKEERSHDRGIKNLVRKKVSM